MRKLILFLLAISVYGFTSAQEVRFFAEVSTDSVLFGNVIEVKFTLENAGEEKFSPPDFEGFQLVGGPNKSSSYTSINGEISQSTTICYYIEPKDVGNYYIGPAGMESDEGYLESDPFEVIVHPNPEGIKQPLKPLYQQDFEFDDFFERTPKLVPKKKKKKRKKYKL